MRIAYCLFATLGLSYSLCAGTVLPTMDFRPVAKSAIPAVVSIQVKTKTPASSYFSDDDDEGNEFWERFFGVRPRGQENKKRDYDGQASGFLISSDGIILTNNHVVDNMSDIKVVLSNGKEYAAKVLGQDSNTDVAVIKIDAKDLPFLVLGDSDKLDVAEPVLAVGNPMGLQATVTGGIVSAKGRNNLDLSRVEDYIQTDAAVNRGNSGGPLLNMQGNVIGMNTAIVTNMANGGYMGIGFAIPSNILKAVAEDLKNGESFKRGYLGILMQQVDADLAQAFHLSKVEGVLVAEVQKDSPGEKGGLKQGDVIVSLNNQTVTNAAALRNAIALMKPGASINLTILREGKPLQLQIALGLFPTSETAGIANQKNLLGIEVSRLTPDLASQLGYEAHSGVVITKIDSQSPVAWAGLKKGALVLEVNRKKISSVEDFNTALKEVENGTPLLFLIKQGDVTRYVSIKISN